MSRRVSVSTVIGTAVIGTAALLLLAAPAARALDGDGGFHFHIDPIVFEVLDVDVDTDSSKFNEYRDIQSGFNLPKLGLFGESGDGNRTFSMRADNVRRDDARYTLGFRDSGRYNLTFDYNKIPHRFGNNGVFLWTRTAPGLFEIADSAQGLLQSQIDAQAAINRSGINFGFLNGLISPFLDAAGSIDPGLLRDRSRTVLEIAKMHRIGVTLEYRHEHREGTRPFAGSFGFGNSIEIVEPIDYDTTDAIVQAEWTTKQGGLRFGYRNSQFENDVSTLVWDNPWFLVDGTDGSAYTSPGANSQNGSSRGFADLAADNSADMFFVDGRWKANGGWRFSGSVNYNAMEQNDPLLPFTLNSAIVGIDHETGATFDPTNLAALGATSADAEVDVLSINANAAKTFGDDWTLTLLYRYYDYDNQSPRLEFPGYVRFHAVWEEVPRITVPYAFTRDDFGAELDWDASKTTEVGFSYHRKGFDREFREINSSDEDVYKLSVSTRPSDRFTVRASWQFGDRTIGDYLTEAQELSFLEPEGVNNQPTLRKYDEAARQFDDYEASVQLMLTDAWNLTVGLSGRTEDYDKSEFGLVSDEILQYNAEISYSPGENLNLYAFGHIADRESFQRARQSGATVSTNPLDTWEATMNENTDTWGVGLNGEPNDRWTWDISGNSSKSDGDVDFFTLPGGTPSSAVDIGDYEDVELLTLLAKIDYKLTDNASIGFIYRYEDYTIDSFNLAGLQPYLASTLLLVANDGDYTANVFGVHLKFAF